MPDMLIIHTKKTILCNLCVHILVKYWLWLRVEVNLKVAEVQQNNSSYENLKARKTEHSEKTSLHFMSIISIGCRLFS